MDIIKYIKGVNLLVVVLDILFLIISFLFFTKKKCSTRVKDIFVIIYTLVNMLFFSSINNMYKSVFTFKFLSVKTYLVVVLITLLILLYTINKKVRLGYKISNYLVSIIIGIILLVNGYIFISDKLNIGNIMDISNVIVLMNVSFIIFSIYLIVLAIIYIGYYVYELSVCKNKEVIVESDEKISIRLNIIERIKRIRFKKISFRKKEKKENNKDRKISLKKIDLKKKLKKKEVVNNDNDIDTDNKENNSLEKLISYNVGDSFYIQGIDCSIIFCDSNKENILKNYDILSQDINAKMVNGYTLDENIMIRDILKKLNVSNLGSVDVNNPVLLNVIDADEYMFLKEILSRN